MRFVDRSEAEIPKFLSGGYVAKMRGDYLRYLQLPPNERRQQRPPDRHLPPDRSLLDGLSALFNGRCAFCENESKLEVYRFRPTSDAQPSEEKDNDAYLAYGWLADAWQNLYPICRLCRPARLNYFPVRTGSRSPVPSEKEYEAYAAENNGNWIAEISEDPLLLDPCADRDIENHLALLEDGSLTPVSRRGGETIEHFNLNRKEAVNRRKRVFERHRSAVEAAVAAGSDGPKTIAEFYDFLSIRSETALLGGYDQILFGHVILKSNRYSASAEMAPDDAGAAYEMTAAPLLPRLTLSSFEIRAFKSLEHIRVEMPKPKVRKDETPRTPALLILGENASGKSSILEALSLTLIGEEARRSLGEKPAKLLLNPLYLGKAHLKPREKATVSLGFMTEDGETVTRRMSMTADGFSIDDGLPGAVPVFAYGAYRHYRSIFQEWQPDRPVISLFRTDNLLSNPEQWLLQLPEIQFEQVIRSLSDIFGIGGTFRVIERDLDEKRCMVVVKFEDEELKTPLDSVSSGFRTILALACDVMRWLLDKDHGFGFTTLDEAHGVIMIDEVEAHLHPRWKVQIMEGLRKALPNMTFIVTTHDPLCLRGMEDGEVLVLQRMPSGEASSETDMPLFVETLTELPNVSQLTVEQLLTSDLFSLFDTDDPRGAKAMAELADALSNTDMGKKPGTEDQEEVLKRYREEVAHALPVGSTQVSQLVQEAVADFVVKNGKLPEKKRKALRDATRNRILMILESGDARG